MSRPKAIRTPATWRDTFIEWLVKEHEWTHGVELGLWKGRTFLHLLETCPDLQLIGVDLWAPQLGHPGPEDWSNWDHHHNEVHVRKHARKYGDRAFIYKGFTVDAADLVDDESQDFVFIDADHSTPGVKADIRAWMPKVKKGGALIGHDIDWPSVKDAVDDLLPGYMLGPNVTWVWWKE